MRRLMKEAEDMSGASPSSSPDITAGPLSDSDLYEWHFTMRGPPSTPFAAGIYHGSITFPEAYPFRPPSFRFLTPSGRFEVNREICLSISGHHEETWQPAWDVRTALLALRAFMGTDSAGQVGGLDASEEVRRDWACRSRSWTCRLCGQSNQASMLEWQRKLVERDAAAEVQRCHKSVAVDATVPEEHMHDPSASTATGNPAAVPPLRETLSEAVAWQAVAPASPQQPRQQVPRQPEARGASEGQRDVTHQSVQVEALSQDKFLDLAITGVFIGLFFMIIKKAFF
ncbi:hypothetical protein KEM52_003145 [Ascosphaera acerosa]|nr:hypothetical protein KEM52_003145 [Ascosphaera acerosa]